MNKITRLHYELQFRYIIELGSRYTKEQLLRGS